MIVWRGWGIVIPGVFFSVFYFLSLIFSFMRPELYGSNFFHTIVSSEYIAPYWPYSLGLGLSSLVLLGGTLRIVANKILAKVEVQAKEDQHPRAVQTRAQLSSVREKLEGKHDFFWLTAKQWAAISMVVAIIILIKHW